MIFGALKTQLSELVENELVTTDYELKSLRVFPLGKRTMIKLRMDRKCGGINVGECAQWNRRFGQLIEEQGLIPGPYMIEVSSPGIAGADYPNHPNLRG